MAASLKNQKESNSNSDYEDDILKKNGDQSDPDKKYEIPLNTLIQESTNQSHVTTEISQDPGVNN